MKYYLKFLGNDRQPCHGGSGQWPEPGEWTETIENPFPRESGYHLCRKQDIIWWCHAPTLWVVEAEGVIPVSDKVVAKRARLIRQVSEWTETNQRLFATDCAEHVLKHFELKYPEDKRPRVAIETARKFAIGQATVKELDAARSAAWSAESVAWPASVWTTDSSKSACYASKSAAWSADSARLGTWFLKSAAMTAAGSSLLDPETTESEHEWQLDTLFSKYLKLNSEEFE